MKTRIVYRNGKYIPQVKYWYYPFYRSFIYGFFGDFEVSFKTREEAEEWLK